IFSSPILAICLFYLFSSTALAASAVLGVDFGTEYIKATLVKPGIPLEIVLTKDSRRKETSAVSFKPYKNPQIGQFPERAYGSDAMSLSARFPGDVYPNLKTLLGLPADNSLVTEYSSRHPALQLVAEKTRGTAAFKSNAFAADEEAWTVEEILAMELQSIQKNAEELAGKGSVVKSAVITVPPFYTVEEKRAIELAAQLAGIKVLELLSDGLAVGLNYATTRTFPSATKGEKPEYHMVFDMGAGSTKASLLRFQARTVKDVGKFNKTIQEVQVLGSGWDRTLGGDSLNAVIIDDMVAQFVASPAAKSVSPSVEAVKSHGRAIAKLSKEAERLRHVLSANANTQASFEGLYEDIDYRYKITRDDFEKLAESHAARVAGPVQRALEMAGMSIAELDSIILHGGASRTPFVQKELEKLLGSSEKLRSNVNSDEAAAFGAGFRGATLSPSFKVKEIRPFEAAEFAAGIKWINANEKPQHQRLWQPTSLLAAEKQFSFKNHEDFTVTFYQQVPSSENVSPGSEDKEILSLTTTNLTASVAHLKDKFECAESDINVKMSAQLNRVDGLPEVTKFSVECEVDEKATMADTVKGLFGFGKKDQVPLEESEGAETVEESASDATSSTTASTSESASPSAKDGKDSKSKSSKRLEVINIAYTTEAKGYPQLPAEEIVRMKERLTAFDDSDRSRRLREEALNQLEGYTYRVRDLLDRDEFVTAATDAEKSELEAKSRAVSDWIYSGGHDASREELRSRLKEMKDIVNPIEKRIEETAQRPKAVEDLQKALNQTSGFIEGVKSEIENYEVQSKSWEAKQASSTVISAPPASSESAGEFEGLEDEDATATTTAPPEEETLPLPIYTMDDITKAMELYETTMKWLEEKLSEQENLPQNADPVILVREITARTKELEEIGVEILMKSMRKPYTTNRPPRKDKEDKGGEKKSSKSKKGGKKKTTSAKDAEQTFD
ncbi:Hsp70 protein-domain-containing protein, partial [Xylogone sp. PMI_703]